MLRLLWVDATGATNVGQAATSTGGASVRPFALNGTVIERYKPNQNRVAAAG